MTKMTIEEATKLLKMSEQAIWLKGLEKEQRKAEDMAIKSLEAWGKVKEEIKTIKDRECLENDSFDEYSEGRYDVACECLRIIDKHLKEVSE